MSVDQQKPATAPSPASAAASGVVKQQQVGKYTVTIDRSKCISAASCVAIAPSVFALDEEGIAKVIGQDGHDDDTKLLAAQSCPTAAITITDTSTGEQVWPK